MHSIDLSVLHNSIAYPFCGHTFAFLACQDLMCKSLFSMYFSINWYLFGSNKTIWPGQAGMVQTRVVQTSGPNHSGPNQGVQTGMVQASGDQARMVQCHRLMTSGLQTPGLQAKPPQCAPRGRQGPSPRQSHRPPHPDQSYPHFYLSPRDVGI